MLSLTMLFCTKYHFLNCHSFLSLLFLTADQVDIYNWILIFENFEVFCKKNKLQFVQNVKIII